MKVLHVLNWSLPTLAGYTVRADCILRAQRALGFDVVGITGPIEGSDTTEVNGVRFHRTKASFANKPSPLREWILYRALRSRLREVAAAERPAILHVHSPMYNGLATASVARELKIPCVYEMRAVWEDALVDSGKFVAGSVPYRVARHLETTVFRRANVIVTICEGLKGEVLHRGVERDRVFVVPNAVESEKFEPVPRDPGLLDELGWQPGGFVFGFLGSLYEYEGVHDLVAAIPDVLVRVPNARFLIVGSGERESLIRERIASLNRPDAIVHKPRVPHAEVKRLYSVVDCLVYPRKKVRLTDLVTPLKPLEAMAMQKCVVASDVGGHKEMIEHDKTGLLYEAGNHSALVDALSHAAQNPDVAARLAAAGRQYVLRNRNWSVVAENYIPAYERALGSSALLPRAAANQL